MRTSHARARRTLDYAEAGNLLIVYVLQRGFGKTLVDVRVDALVGPFIWQRHATNATRFATASR